MQSVRFTKLRYFFSQLYDALFDGRLHEDRLAEQAGGITLQGYVFTRGPSGDQKGKSGFLVEHIKSSRVMAE